MDWQGGFVYVGWKKERNENSLFRSVLPKAASSKYTKRAVTC
jgi:hypothetical protein